MTCCKCSGLPRRWIFLRYELRIFLVTITYARSGSKSENRTTVPDSHVTLQDIDTLTCKQKHGTRL